MKYSQIIFYKIKKSIMENENLKKSLGDKLYRKTKLNKIKAEVKPVISESTTSKYFSPVQTRNQRKIKIEYEKDSKAEKKPILKIEKNAKRSCDDISIKKFSRISETVSETQLDKKLETTKKSSKKTQSDEIQFPSKELTNEAQSERNLFTQEESPNKIQKWEPANWKQIYENLKIMRSNTLAPVDTMGCDKCSDDNADEKTKRYHVLVSLMLSSQTKDQVTYEAMQRLKEKNLQPSTIAAMELDKLEKLLNPVGFYRNKAKYLKQTAQILIDKYDSDIPNTIKDLIKLPGVGPKMAHICMNSAWNIVTGIGVDVHVHRISNRLCWVRKTTKEPEKTRIELESWLPSEYWSEINHLLVGFGQTICTPINPKCGECLNKNICPSAFLKKTTKKPFKIQC